MKDKSKVVNQTIKKISWILKNPYLKNYITNLINEFISSNCSISKTTLKQQIAIEFTKENTDTLFISISSDLNEVKISYEKNKKDINGFKKIKRCDDEIEVLEKDSSVLRKNGKIVSTYEVENNKL